MGKLVVNTFTTLDGVMQAPGMPEEDREGGFDQGGWQVPYFDEESGQVMAEGMASFDALLVGRKTYEIFASYWPNAPADDPTADRLNKVPKYVASRTLANVTWENSTLLEGDIENEVPKLKEAYNEIHTSGSGNLVQSLMKRGSARVGRSPNSQVQMEEPSCDEFCCRCMCRSTGSATWTRTTSGPFRIGTRNWRRTSRT